MLNARASSAHEGRGEGDDEEPVDRIGERADRRRRPPARAAPPTAAAPAPQMSLVTSLAMIATPRVSTSTWRALALPAHERPHAAQLEHQAEERRHEERDHQRQREADPRIEGQREIRAQHVEDAVRDVDDALQPEHDGQPRGEQDVDRADGEAVEHLQQRCVTPSRRGAARGARGRAKARPRVRSRRCAPSRARRRGRPPRTRCARSARRAAPCGSPA